MAVLKRNRALFLWFAGIAILGVILKVFDTTVVIPTLSSQFYLEWWGWLVRLFAMPVLVFGLVGLAAIGALCWRETRASTGPLESYKEPARIAGIVLLVVFGAFFVAMTLPVFIGPGSATVRDFWYGLVGLLRWIFGGFALLIVAAFFR